MKTTAFIPKACRFYCKGSCLFDEMRNPGLEERYRCAALVRLVRSWDDFTDRAELLGMDMKAAIAVWEQRQQNSLYARKFCPQAVASAHPVSELDSCPQIHEGLCLAALPVCEGRCTHYEVG